jgi:hypothetical protein
MTPQRAAMLLNTEMRLDERRARMGTKYLRGTEPTVERIQRDFGMSNQLAHYWAGQIRQAREKFGA